MLFCFGVICLIKLPVKDQLYKDILKSSVKLIERTINICTDLVQPHALEAPVKVEEIYGNKDWGMYVNFQMGFSIVGILFCSVIFSSATMFDEKKEGSIDRVLSVGVTMWEIVIGHILQHSISAIICSLELYFLIYHVFDLPIVGNNHLVIFLLFLTSMTGVFLGGSVGLLVEHQTAAVNAACGLNFGVVSLSGMMWPIQGAHKIIRPILPYFPVTNAINTLRDITMKGYGLTKPAVAEGFAQIIFWMTVCCALEIIVIKTQKGAWNK